jgi:hypothetical protein
MKNVFIYTMFSILVLSIVGMSLMNPFSQEYSVSTEIGTTSNFKKEGVLFKNWSGEFQSTEKDSSQPGSRFNFSILNDNEKNPLRKILDSASKNNWKIKIEIYKIFGYNQLINRASETVFIKNVEILDRDYAVNKELEERDLSNDFQDGENKSIDENILDSIETGRDTSKFFNGKDTVVYIVVYKDSANKK